MMNFKNDSYKNAITLVILLVIFSISCQTKNHNPLLNPFNTPHEVPPFEQLKAEHFKTAVDLVLIETRSAIDKIVNNKSQANFKNTIEALEYSTEKLNHILSIFYFTNASSSNAEMVEIHQEISQKNAELEYELLHNQVLFEKIKYVYDNRHQAGLNPEEIQLTENYFNSRIKNGIGLSKEKQERLLLIDGKLSELSQRFYSNVMQDTKNKFLNIKDSSVLSGLPQDVMNKAKKDAVNRGKDGWVFTTSPTSDNPLLTYADNRELRKVYYEAYAKIGANQNEYNNEKIALNIAYLRLEKANILGYDTYADYALIGSMAQDKENVKLFLETQQSSLLPLAIGEYEELNTFAQSIGFNSSIQSWDWHYYSQKLKAQKYDIDDAEIKEYFPYTQVQAGVFNLVERLWGLKFVLNQNIPVYHPNVMPYEVYEDNGDLLGILMLDLFDREQKGDIGYTSLHRPQIKQNGKRIIPIVGITDSYPNSEGDIPSLLSMTYVKSFLHEMGHALHGLFSDVTYRRLSGTNVDQDFLEFPSTLMEQWMYEKSFLETIAFHYKTGEKMSSEMMDNLIASIFFQQAFQGFNINSLSMIDYAWHSLTNPINIPVTQFEEKILPQNQFRIHSERIISTSLIYIFRYGYESYLYSYDWCDMIAKDAFQVFKEHGIYNRKIAADLRTHILSKGGSEHPMALYKRFRGKEPEFKSKFNRIN